MNKSKLDDKRPDAVTSSKAVVLSPDERRAQGKALRDAVSRESQGGWKPPKGRRDPIEVLTASNEGRVPELVPIRFGRMLQSPFAFYRGSAATMAAGLASTPNSGLRVQACGDAHLPNFGGFATPERQVVFDINDLDETLPAPSWKKAGGEVVSINPMSYNKDTDFYSGVSRVISAKPDVMFVGGASEPTALVVRQARELGFKGGFAVMDQAKLDEMSRVLDGFAMVEGAIGVMPLVHDTRPGAEDFVARFRKAYNRDPGSEMSYHYSALNALVEAMKLSGSVSDPKAIHAKMNEAYGKLTPQKNPSRISGIDERGGSNAQIVVGLVEKGKIMPIEAGKTN